jgi:Flp pilus assembly protein TadD
MRYYDMSPQEQRAYQNHLIDLVVLNDLADEITEAKEQAKKEKKRADKAEKLAKAETKRATQAEKLAEEEKQRAEEEKKLRYTYILRMKQQGYPVEKLMEITGLSREEIERL